MPFNLLLLPLLGGFVFVRYWNLSRFYALRSDGYLLIFSSALAGGIFLTAASILVAAVNASQYAGNFVQLGEWWNRVAPFEYSGRTALAGLLGAILWLPLNLFFRKKRQINRLVKKGDPLLSLFRKAIDRTMPVMISLKSGKVYVGLVSNNPFTIHPAFPIRSMKLIPSYSGYRDEKNRRVRFTTDYVGLIEKVRAGEQIIPDRKFTEDDFEIVIPVEDIQSAKLFDPNLYKVYFHKP